LQNRNYKSTTNEAVKLTARFYENKNTTRRRRRDDPLCKLRSARENPFSLSVPEEPGSGLRSEINLVRSFVIHVYLQERRQANGGSLGKGEGVEIEGVRNMKYEGRNDGRGKFVRFLSFCSKRWKERTSTGSFVNCPVEPWRLDKGETDYASY